MDQTECVNVNFWAIIDFEIRLTDPLLLLAACFLDGTYFWWDDGQWRQGRTRGPSYLEVSPGRRWKGCWHCIIPLLSKPLKDLTV